MIVVPIVAAHGLLIPKTSSRAITSPAGTADTMEVLSRVDLSEDEIRRGKAPVTPTYTKADAVDAMHAFRTAGYGEWFSPADSGTGQPDGRTGTICGRSYSLIFLHVWMRQQMTTKEPICFSGCVRLSKHAGGDGGSADICETTGHVNGQTAQNNTVRETAGDRCGDL